MGDSRSERPLVLLDRMPQQAEVRVADDDWTGRSDAAERRKLQNRLHQRTYRKRQKLRKSQEQYYGQTNHGPDAEQGGFRGKSGPSPGAASFAPPHNQISAPNSSPEQLILPPHPQSSPPQGLTPSQIQTIIDQFSTSFSTAYHLGSPRADLLLTLIQFNVFRALASNSLALGFPFSWLSADALSPFNSAPPHAHSALPPPDLRCTALQRRVPHHPWIDLFPIAALRDNLLWRGEEFDDEALCHDLVEVCHCPSERSGLINWGEPWVAGSWEVTEEFAGRWGWMLRGCEGLLRSTNYWRRRRGEEGLVFDVSMPDFGYD